MVQTSSANQTAICKLNAPSGAHPIDFKENKMKIQTLDEMEAENPDVFKNPPVTPEEEARDQRRWEERRIANESLPDEPEDHDEDDEEDDEDEDEEEQSED